MDVAVASNRFKIIRENEKTLHRKQEAPETKASFTQLEYVIPQSEAKTTVYTLKERPRWDEARFE